MSARDLRAAIFGVLVVATIASVTLLLPTTGSPPTPSGSAAPSTASPATGRLALSAKAFGSDPIANPPSAPTGDDGQSKVWLHDGRWWAALIDRESSGFHIFGLDWASQDWFDTGVVLDDRPNAHPDVLVDGGKLYTVSAGHSRIPSARPQLKRFSYDGQGWSLDPGFPVDVAAAGVGSVSIGRDSAGRLWVAIVDGGQVLINASREREDDWGPPWPLPGPGTTVRDEDVARVVAHGPGRIGVMWSNQIDATFRFAVHRDEAAPEAWTTETVLSGPMIADNHIDLATARFGADERVVAVVKTSRNEAVPVDRNDGLILLLTQKAEGGWSESIVGRVRDHQTRPLILVDSRTRSAVVATTSDEVGSSITYQAASLDDPDFVTGPGAPLIGDEDDQVVDATSTHQDVDLAQGVVVVAWDERRGRYMHAVLSLSG